MYEVDVESIVLKGLNRVCEEQFRKVFTNQPDYVGDYRLEQIITNKIADKYIEDNYENIVQNISKDDISKYVAQRAILLTGRKVVEGD